jgi:glycosyltransferase involved in cell wall biosynthesis
MELSIRESRKRIAYILGRYPSLTMTFIEREVQELKRQGVALVIVAIRPPASWEKAMGIREAGEGTKYIFPLKWAAVLQANGKFLLSKLFVYCSTLFYVLTRRDASLTNRIKSSLLFTEGVLAAALLRSEGVDHIHAHFVDGTGVVAMVASRLLGVPYSITAHAYDIYVKSPMFQDKITSAKFVTTCTAYNKRHLEEVTGREINLVYHGLDLPTIKVEFESRQDYRPLILSIGMLKEKKGIPYLVRACRLLKDEGYDVRCEIIGQGPSRNELEVLIADLKLCDTVILRGALPHNEVTANYARATILVQPSIIAENADRDGIPNVVLEALANGVPVVATRVSGIPEVIDDGVTGVLSDPGDERALAQAIRRLLDNPRLRSELAERGRRLVEERFNIRKNVDRLIELFEA